MKSSTIKRHSSVAHIAFGSNLGSPQQHIADAVRKLSTLKGSKILRVSSIYKTSPVGGPAQKDFLNGVVKLRTELTAKELLRNLLRIERELGRKRRVKWGPRSIDLDLISLGTLILRSRLLQVPHPRYHERRFVLVPLCEVSPYAIHPVLRRRNSTLLRQLTPGDQRVTILRRWKK